MTNDVWIAVAVALPATITALATLVTALRTQRSVGRPNGTGETVQDQLSTLHGQVSAVEDRTRRFS